MWSLITDLTTWCVRKFVLNFNNVEKRKFTDRLLKLPFTGIYTKTQNLTKLKALGHDLGSNFSKFIFFIFNV